MQPCAGRRPRSCGHSTPFGSAPCWACNNIEAGDPNTGLKQHKGSIMTDRLITLDGIIGRYTRWINGHRDRMLSFFSEDFYPKIQQQVDQIETLVGREPPATILDLACGTGSATVELVARWNRKQSGQWRFCRSALIAMACFLILRGQGCWRLGNPPKL